MLPLPASLTESEAAGRCSSVSTWPPAQRFRLALRIGGEEDYATPHALEAFREAVNAGVFRNEEARSFACFHGASVGHPQTPSGVFRRVETRKTLRRQVRASRTAALPDANASAGPGRAGGSARPSLDDALPPEPCLMPAPPFEAALLGSHRAEATLARLKSEVHPRLSGGTTVMRFALAAHAVSLTGDGDPPYGQRCVACSGGWQMRCSMLPASGRRPSYPLRSLPWRRLPLSSGQLVPAELTTASLVRSDASNLGLFEERRRRLPQHAWQCGLNFLQEHGWT